MRLDEWPPRNPIRTEAILIGGVKLIILKRDLGEEGDGFPQGELYHEILESGYRSTRLPIRYFSRAEIKRIATRAKAQSPIVGQYKSLGSFPLTSSTVCILPVSPRGANVPSYPELGVLRCANLAKDAHQQARSRPPKGANSLSVVIDLTSAHHQLGR